jgi:hypothetical protein
MKRDTYCSCVAYMWCGRPDSECDRLSSENAIDEASRDEEKTDEAKAERVQFWFRPFSTGN